MIYLSRIPLNPRARQVQSELRDPYQMHRTLSRGFGDVPPNPLQGNGLVSNEVFPLGAPRPSGKTLQSDHNALQSRYQEARCLFRVDETPDGKPFVLVQSCVEPDWAYLSDIKQYLADAVQMKTFNPQLPAGQILAFRLYANPTVRHDGKRHALREDEELIAWLNRKGEQGGFCVLRAANTPPERNIFGSGNTGEKNVVLWGVRFDGRLKVSDPELFLETIKSGIGSSKGYGFGLLSLARG